MSDEQRRFLATAAFHDKMARTFRAMGNLKDAIAAERAAALCRASAEAA